MRHNYWACAYRLGATATEAQESYSPCAAVREVTAMRSLSLQLEKTPPLSTTKKVLTAMKTQQTPKLTNNFQKHRENGNFTWKKPGRQHLTMARHADATSLLLGSELLPRTLFCTHSMLSGSRPHMTFSSISISVLNCRSYDLFLFF